MSAEEALGVETGGEADHHMTPQQAAASKKLQATHAKVDEVVDIMQSNMNKLLERDENLTTLQEKSEGLKESSSLFQAGASRLKHKFQWANVKLMIIIGVVLLIVFVIIIAKVMPDRHEPQSQIDHSHHAHAANSAAHVAHAVAEAHQQHTQKNPQTPPQEPTKSPPASGTEDTSSGDVSKTDSKVV